jgi:hypothetical protein
MYGGSLEWMNPVTDDEYPGRKKRDRITGAT